MSGFNSASFLVRSRDGLNFTLEAPFVFTRASGEAITVPAGSQSDGASTPAVLWPTIPPFGIYWRAAFLHDYLYRDTQRPKDECDQIFKEAMEWSGVSPELTETIYQGVHLGGWSSFEDDRAAQLP